MLRTDILGQDALHLIHLLMHAADLPHLLMVECEINQLLLQDPPKVELGAQVHIKF